MGFAKILFCIAAAAYLGSGVAGSPRVTPAIMYFPDGDGNIKPSIVVADQRDVPPIDGEKDVTFFLYTRRGSSQLFVGNDTLLHDSTFDGSLPTLIVTHGYHSSVESSTVQKIKEMYLSVKDCNVIGVDWSGLADNILYNVVKEQTIQIGAYVAKFIDFLVDQTKMDVANVHLSGHSLGAHVMGLSGKNVQSGLIERITGIDPAGPLYTVENATNRLAVGDAKFVDVIHACGGMLSFEDAIGDVDFFPNGGIPPQPGCEDEMFGECSHSRSWQYFAESVNSDKFKSVPCNSYEDYKEGKCDSLPKVSMGEPAPKDTRGTYYLKTASSPPFALG